MHGERPFPPRFSNILFFMTFRRITLKGDTPIFNPAALIFPGAYKVIFYRRRGYKKKVPILT